MKKRTVHISLFLAAGTLLVLAAGAAASFLISSCTNVTNPRTEQSSAPAAKSGRGKVLLRWSAESAQNLYGFNIYRGVSAEGPWMRVNDKPILAKEGGTTNIPYDYELLDAHPSIQIGQSYWYWVEGLNVDGTRFRAWWPPTRKVISLGINDPIPKLNPADPPEK